jgi:hypothetical protein
MGGSRGPNEGRSGRMPPRRSGCRHPSVGAQVGPSGRDAGLWGAASPRLASTFGRFALRRGLRVTAWSTALEAARRPPSTEAASHANPRLRPTFPAGRSSTSAHLAQTVYRACQASP